MAMNLTQGDSQGESEMMMEINTTPLIDVMLVLLVMFIITIPIQLHAVRIELPQGVPPPRVEPLVVRIDVDAHGELRWQGEPVDDADALALRLRDSAALPVPPELHVRAHDDAPYAAVAGVLAAAQRHGLKKLGLVGSE